MLCFLEIVISSLIILLNEDLVDGFLDAKAMGGYFPVVLLFIFLLLI
jgi:hypothetical protein